MAGHVAAEEFLLFSKGHWSVTYSTERDEPSCVAAVQTPELYFSLDVTSEGIEAWFMSVANNYGPTPQEGVISLWIDDKTAWDTPAYAMNDSIIMPSLAGEFLMEIYLGKTLYVDKNYDGNADAWFSLDGSAAAIVALSDCSKKLGGFES